MGRADLAVVEAAVPPQGHGPLAVGNVVAEAEVGRAAAPGGMGPGPRGVRLARRPAADRPVRTLLVVGEAEGVELRLQLDHAGRRRPGRWRGSGTTNPAAWRMRRVVEVDGTG